MCHTVTAVYDNCVTAGSVITYIGYDSACSCYYRTSDRTWDIDTSVE